SLASEPFPGACAVGSFIVGRLARLVTPATKGFLSFTAACAAGFGLLAYLSDTSLPVIGAGAAVTGDPPYDMPRRVALVAFVRLAVLSMILIARGRQARVVLILG